MRVRRSWSGRRLGYDAQTDEQGITTTYEYDLLGRLDREERSGIVTKHVYDKAGREIETRRTANGQTLTSSRTYDGAGRVKTSTDEHGLTTEYVYSADGRTTTVIRPGGATEITTTHLDGRVQSVSGTGVVAQSTTYGVNPDGSQWTEVQSGASTERTTVDMLGRTVRVERSGFGGAVEVSESFYNERGQLVRTTQPGAPATLYAYDAMGNQVRVAQDVNGNGSIDLAGPDRVQESETRFVLLGNAIWQESAQRVYASAVEEPLTVSVQRSRMSGFGGGVIAESQSVDLHGNATSSQTLLNAAGATVTQIVDVPDSETNQVTISVQGRVIASTSASGLMVSFGYDGFGRRTAVADSRTGTSTTHYDAQGRVDYVEDAEGRRTSFGYDPTTGRKVRETNANGKVTRFSYTDRGELERTWGDVPYPVEYAYDAQGRRTKMRTFRVDAAWSGETWPTGVTGDETTWEYDGPSGLVVAKHDASGAAVRYAYGPGGRLTTRTWARTGAGNAALVTTYGYDPETGELASVDYSDTTPDVSFAYDRLGRTVTVTDGSGTRTFAYDPEKLHLSSETVSGLVPAVLTHKHATEGVLGRSAGYSLGVGHDVTYSYDSKGRFGGVSWNVSGQSDNVTYARVAGSELLESVTYGSGVKATYAYEARRDLKTQVKNSFGASTISQYDYAYDAIGRRTSVKNAGSAFASAAFNKWQYNDRNELIESGRYLGTDVANTGSPVADEYRGYTFDPLGNRITATEGTQQKSYQTNLLNEYTTAAGASLTYDADGNLTSDGTRKFTYDAENRLVLVEPVAVVTGSTRVRMAYDYLGRRVQKVVEEFDGSAWAAADDVRFVYLGWNVIEERRESGGVSTKKNFVWGLDLSQSMDGAGGIGGLLAVVDEQGGQMAFLYDANGNVGQLVDEQGSVVARYEYDAFGNVLVAEGVAAEENAWRFSTKYADQETGLVYYGYRFYEPVLGRWVNRDPTGERGGLNVFVAMSNAPVMRIDAFGLRDYLVGSEDPQITRVNQIGPYAVSTPSYGDYALWATLRSAAWVAQAAVPHAAEMYLHFLGASGTDFNIDVKHLLDNDQEAREMFENEARRALSFARKLDQGEHEITSGATLSDYPENKDWHYAIGAYDLYGKGRVRRCGDTTELFFDYRIADTYDFNWGDYITVNLLPSFMRSGEDDGSQVAHARAWANQKATIRVADEVSGLFVRQGLARNYNIRGSYKHYFRVKGDVAEDHAGWLPF